MKLLWLAVLVTLVAGCTYSEKSYTINTQAGAVTIKTDDAISAQKTPTINPTIDIPLVK